MELIQIERKGKVLKSLSNDEFLVLRYVKTFSGVSLYTLHSQEIFKHLDYIQLTAILDIMIYEKKLISSYRSGGEYCLTA